VTVHRLRCLWFVDSGSVGFGPQPLLDRLSMLAPGDRSVCSKVLADCRMLRLELSHLPGMFFGVALFWTAPNASRRFTERLSSYSTWTSSYRELFGIGDWLVATNLYLTGTTLRDLPMARSCSPTLVPRIDPCDASLLGRVVVPIDVALRSLCGWADQGRR
jgi:hypothetical protein